MKNMHYIAPEYGSPTTVTPAVDIYSFGMCALEMAALEISGNGDSGNLVTQEHIQKTILSLEHKLQQDFINKCLNPDPRARPYSTKLLFHPVLFEVHSLKLLAAHRIIHNPKKSNKYMDACLEDMLQKQCHPESVVAELPHRDRAATLVTMADIPVVEKLEKFMEDVRFGIYPLTVFKLPQQNVRPRPLSPEAESAASTQSPSDKDHELRKIVNMMCSVRSNENGKGLFMTLSLRLDDKMNRQLSCVLKDGEKAGTLADELVKYRFINQIDRERVVGMVDSELTRYHNGGFMPEVNGDTCSPLHPLGNGGQIPLRQQQPPPITSR